MEPISLSLILDGVILILLLATIAYAVRLTAYLKKFKESRAGLEKIIQDLSIHINKADNAVSELNDAVDASSYDLQNRMDNAAKMFDELELVVQTGDSLASRLENLAIRNRRIIEGNEGDVTDLMNHTRADETPYETRLEDIVKKTDQASVPSPTASRPTFAIRDPEMERDDTANQDGFTLDDGDVLSEAERDLYDALQKTKQARRGDA